MLLAGLICHSWLREEETAACGLLSSSEPRIVGFQESVKLWLTLPHRAPVFCWQLVAELSQPLLLAMPTQVLHWPTLPSWSCRVRAGHLPSMSTVTLCHMAAVCLKEPLWTPALLDQQEGTCPSLTPHGPPLPGFQLFLGDPPSPPFPGMGGRQKLALVCCGSE